MDVPVPGSAQEDARFHHLQKRLVAQFCDVFPDPLKPRTVVVIPSLTLDADVLHKVSGAHHYEERMLCMLLLLRMPATHVIYVSSQAIDPTIIDYMLHLLPGIPVHHARKRLTLLSCRDASSAPLSRKILDRPRLLRRIQTQIPDLASAHMTCFNVTALEKTLAVRLGIPLYACDPALTALGSKSGSRKMFAEAGVKMPEGVEDLRDAHDLVQALADLKHQSPTLRRAVVKLNEGFSGEGNAVFSYAGAPAGASLPVWLRQELPARLRFEATGETWESYCAKFETMGGIVERFIDHDIKRSPSAQCRIDPLGHSEVISTHDQVLGGPSGQVFLGCTFPADEAYRLDIQRAGDQVAEVLRQRGVLGRFAIDFVSTKEGEQWEHYAIEINLRKGGTTHPFLMLEFLTDGAYDKETGLYYTPSGQPRFYYASDNLQSPLYRGLAPEDLIDISVVHQLHFQSTTQRGVVFHLIGALSEFGKLGVVCIDESVSQACQAYEETVAILNAEAQSV
ncbi:MAG: peptide ligase PGM1-related protein [Candidatus Tectomicrobia bacterium]|nr:peptide ligase PGM1-related protein [Candidatus Tectomicrobia bacterium]